MRSHAVRLVAMAATALLLVGCTSGSGSAGASAGASAGGASPAAPSPRPTATASAAASPSAPPTSPVIPSASASEPAPSAIGVTQTPWGAILDAAPSTFPVYPDAAVADPPPGGAVSGAWASTASVASVAGWYRDALQAANYAKVELGSPLEDGSRVIDVQGDLPECRAQVTVKPANGSTMITVLIGAGCMGAGDG